MDADRAAPFLAEHHRAVLVTARSDGRPQTSPVLCGVDDDGAVMVSTRETAMKVHNARRRPEVSLCVLSDDFFGPWLQVDGTAEIVPLPEAMDGLIALYRQAAGEHPDWEDFRAAMERERRVLLRIVIQRVGPTRSG